MNVDDFGSLYSERTDLDFNLLAGQIGPRSFIGPALNPVLSVRPFVSGSYQTLGGDTFLKIYGGGVNLRASLGARAIAAATFSYARQDFDDTAERLVSDRTGNAWSGVADLVYVATLRLLLRAAAIARRDDANTAYQAYDCFGGSLGVAWSVPVRRLAGPVSFSFLAGYSRSDYDAPDPSLDPATNSNCPPLVDSGHLNPPFYHGGGHPKF